MNQVKCIVLRKTRFGEADLILNVLNQQGSKMSFIARSALRSKKRFGGGVLEPTHYIKASYLDSKKEGLKTLSEATLLEEFAGIKRDYDRLNMAFHWLSLTEQLSQEEDLDAENVFHLLGNALKKLENHDNLISLKFQFELKLLNYLGVLPKLKEAEVFLRQNLGADISGENCTGELEGKIRRTIERYRSGLSG